MVVYQKRSRRKVSGGRYISSEKKRLANMGSLPTLTKVGETKIKQKREIGGNLKSVLLSANKVNVIDPKTKKGKVIEISKVIESPANRHFIRRNIITKGSVVETKLGKVKITSRPGQEGTLNGVLIQ
ncbi:30S ribosomal protein S8e [Candidatus Woesearchaeota archaeon]|nr:30S ribosomal protein S8e [Candidatus Woesearchaeota archaeon]